jgi:predicted  nucleic acid-binding Zn-ribbon protein
MSTAREILEARKAALSSELEPLVAKRKKFFSALMETDEKINDARREIAAIENALKSLADSQAKSRQIPIMRAILEVLKDKPEGMTAKEILAALNAKYFDGKLMRHSLSPQLSRLKDRDDKIEYRNERWIRKPDQPSLFKKRF